MVSGAPLSAFETDLGRIGALICYDCEFPVLASTLAADVLLVPSCTEAHAGMSRVQIGSRARALEGQCYVAHAPLVGAVEHCELVDNNTGQAGIYGPPDTGFPEDGVVAAGESDSPGWVLADFEPEAMIKTRQQGAVAPLAHGTEAKACGQKAVHRPLSQKHP